MSENFDVVGNVTYSPFQGLTLGEYRQARLQVCKDKHSPVSSNCCCLGLATVAEKILKFGYMNLKAAFVCISQHLQPCEACVPDIAHENASVVPTLRKEYLNNVLNYTSAHAKRFFLQMPLAAVLIKKGCQNKRIILCEKNANFSMLETLLQRIETKKRCTMSLPKEIFKELIHMCESDSERNRLKYAVAKASGASSWQMRTTYGVKEFSAKAEKIQQAMTRVNEIKEGIEQLARIKEKAILASLGIEVSDSDELQVTSGSETDSEAEPHPNVQPSEHNDTNCHDKSSTPTILADNSKIHDESRNEVQDDNKEDKTSENQVKQVSDRYELPLNKQYSGHVGYMNSVQLMDVLRKWDLNWFAFAECLRTELSNMTDESFSQLLLDFASQLPFMGLSVQEELQIEQSRQTFLYQERLNEQMENIDNGIIVSDDEFDNEPVNWNELHDPLKGKGKELIMKRVQSLRRKSVRECKKKIEEERLLRRKRSKSVGRILKEFPNIGKDIESFVESSGVGADAWRRTGVLTFDGNRKVKKKVTFCRIKEHLEEKYKATFGYGSIVQLCVARNRRRRSANNYREVAKVTCRRARKGFDLKFNPDCHWSCALYRGLDYIQYMTGVDKVILNRDDLSVFRLDSMATSNKCATVCIKGKAAKATKTDYQQSYPSTLQTSSYNFTGTRDTGELCAGVVKGALLHNKNAAQHAADLEMIQQCDEFQCIFHNKDTETLKEIECIRVDSGHDEAPCFEEIQFWWAKRHLERPTRVQLVTSRHSGGSNLNRVELQNGCEVKARSNLFIPSTLNGTNTNDSGKIDEQKLKENINDAIEVYISRIDKAPMGDTVIQLQKGADSQKYQLFNRHVKTFLNGKKEAKEALRLEHPDDYSTIQRIWDVRNRHINRDVPTRYVYHLVCCYQPDCPHPLCKAGEPDNSILWYKDGPPITFIPLPVKDKNRPYNASNCSTCQEECAGHFMQPQQIVENFMNGLQQQVDVQPPSEILKSEFKKEGAKLLEEESCRRIASNVLLKPSEVKMWLQHLKSVQDHRKEGAKRAVITRSRKTVEQKRQKQPRKVTTDKRKSKVSCWVSSAKIRSSYVLPVNLMSISH